MSRFDLDHWRGVSWEKRFEIWAYPVAIISDRYGGVYSKGQWLAVAGFARGKMGEAALKMLNCEGDIETEPNPWGGDTGAGDFWSDPPSWIAVGDTPDAALAALKAKNANINWPFDDQTDGA
jgi:hypothetical protein